MPRPHTVRRDDAPTPRGRQRREQLLSAAAELVAERGFSAVGIADIGAAAGVTASALYRHFATKQELLVALLDRVTDDLLLGARTVVRDVARPRDQLDELVRRHVQFALRDRAIIRVYEQESHNLPPAAYQRVRRKQRRYVGIWADILSARDPRLDGEATRAVVQVTFGMLNSVARFRSGLEDETLAALLADMARAALRSAHSP